MAEVTSLYVWHTHFVSKGGIDGETRENYEKYGAEFTDLTTIASSPHPQAYYPGDVTVEFVQLAPIAVVGGKFTLTITVDSQ